MFAHTDRLRKVAGTSTGSLPESLLEASQEGLSNSIRSTSDRVSLREVFRRPGPAVAILSWSLSQRKSSTCDHQDYKAAIKANEHISLKVYHSAWAQNAAHRA